MHCLAWWVVPPANLSRRWLLRWRHPWQWHPPWYELRLLFRIGTKERLCALIFVTQYASMWSISWIWPQTWNTSHMRASCSSAPAFIAPYTHWCYFYDLSIGTHTSLPSGNTLWNNNSPWACTELKMSVQHTVWLNFCNTRLLTEFKASEGGRASPLVLCMGHTVDGPFVVTICCSAVKVTLGMRRDA